MIFILRAVKESAIASSQFEVAQNNAVKEFKEEIVKEFDKFLSEKYPVKLNEKILNQKGE